ncbi:TldD/PmbA family protein [Nocardiopsis salina]|uniref:TldD/PmbA family protein n=1 Tax=Nocardiopsis salina TaxID=245836 RepID=UPI00034C518D|nr:TldD/PmbA family protein [Nocardiopsis salina]
MRSLRAQSPDEVLPHHLLMELLDELRRSGADYADAFVEERDSRSAVVGDGRVEDISNGWQCGVGFRVLRGARVGSCSTEDLSAEGLREAAHRAGKTAGAAVPEHALSVGIASRVARNRSWPGHEGICDWSPRLELLRIADTGAREAENTVKSVRTTWFESLHRIQVATSEGVRRSEQRARTRMHVRVAAADRTGRTATGARAPGKGGGLERFTAETDPAAAAREAARQAVRLLDARDCPGGELPLVLQGGAAGAFLHEACGHSLEAGEAGGTSPFDGLAGHLVAPQTVTVTDDHTLAGGWATESFDDEGTDATRTVLIDRGRLVSRLHDRASARRAGVQGTGNGRRPSFRGLPSPRMTNLLVSPGEDDPDEILSQTCDGVLAREFGRGAVDPVTGLLTFDVTEGYRIRAGHVCEPLRGVRITGHGPKMLASIDRVGDDVEVTPLVCTKDNQKAMVSAGSPTLRVTGASIGGR